MHSPHLVLLLAQSIQAELKTTMPENFVCLCLYQACPVAQTARGAPFLATVQTYGHKYKRQMWEQPDEKNQAPTEFILHPSMPSVKSRIKIINKTRPV